MPDLICLCLHYLERSATPVPEFPAVRHLGSAPGSPAVRHSAPALLSPVVQRSASILIASSFSLQEDAAGILILLTAMQVLL